MGKAQDLRCWDLAMRALGLGRSMMYRLALFRCVSVLGFGTYG